MGDVVSERAPTERKILKGVARWTAYYRANPHLFARDYLHINLRIFQQILLVMMNWSSITVFIGSRGIGKTYLSAIFCVIKCILYPGTKICVASGTRGQAYLVLEKIMLELVPGSPELALEIKEHKVNGTNQQIIFKNGSYIKVVTAGDSARGNRATLLLLDEFRMISKDVIDTVLRKFLTQRRMPKYGKLSNKERVAEYEKEKNATMYLSSAFFVDHWSYLKCTDTFKSMMNDSRRQFVCGLPYQLSLSEGFVDSEQILSEITETDFNEIKFLMEYAALWYGNTGDSFFDYGSASKNRRVKFPMLPAELSSKVGNSSLVKIQPKAPGEVRILSADIALMSSKKADNDASSIHINQMKPTKVGGYTSNIVYSDTNEGLRTRDQALVIRKLFDEFQCDWLVLDTSGLGLGVYDALSGNLTDRETGEVYPALSCYNDEEMASRCAVVGAPRVIWSIKASAQFNSDAAYGLREGFRSGKIRLLQTEYDGEISMGEIRGFNSLSPSDKLRLQMPYYQTTLLIDEITKLKHEEKNGRVRVYERYGKRKDRYSSLSYNYYVAREIEKTLVRKALRAITPETMFVARAPSRSRNKGGREVGISNGNRKFK